MAKKDAYYFSHDSNAQDDPKCMLLIDQLGMEGYGIFWGLIEKLRNEADYTLPMSILNSLARRWGTSLQKVQTVVKKYGLFEVENDLFFSLRLKRSMIEKSEKARKSISYRWKNDTNVYDRNTNDIRNDTIKGKESKVKERKVFIAPSQDDVFAYMSTKISEPIAKVQAARFFNYYSSNGWKVGKSSMKSWQHAANNWLSNINNYGNSKSGSGKQSPYNSRNGGAQIILDGLKSSLSEHAAGRAPSDQFEI